MKGRSPVVIDAGDVGLPIQPRPVDAGQHAQALVAAVIGDASGTTEQATGLAIRVGCQHALAGGAETAVELERGLDAAGGAHTKLSPLRPLPLKWTIRLTRST
jgi:hypothetical protein